MCTVTWWRSDGGEGYEVFFNRDELRGRGVAKPPGLGECNGVAYAAPTDADQGGTWLWVNARGVTVGIVNHYPAEVAAGKIYSLSRGTLARSLADAGSVAAVGARLAQADLTRCRAFYLVAFGLGEAAQIWRWDTRLLQQEPMTAGRPFLTSSSFQGREITAHRRKLFEKEQAKQGRLGVEELAQFHLRPERERPAWGVLMDRPDARTVSVSQVSVGRGGEAVFHYQARLAEDGAGVAADVVTRLQLAEYVAQSNVKGPGRKEQN